MQIYDFHIHGKPYSHDLWKNDALSDYLSSMYSNTYLNASADESYLIIEIYNKTVHYTYIRSKGIRDNAEREGSFFAITVSLREHICSVVILYNLLDQIYNKIAKASFFTQSKIAGYLKYKVLQLEDANVANQMLLAFENNVTYLNLREISNLTDTFRSNETRIVSLRDVDSPEFEEMLFRNRIVVSPTLSSAVKRCGAIESELANLNTQKQTLLLSNEQLQSELAALTQENQSLSAQLHASASSTEKKYRSKLDQLQNDLSNITRERDSLKQKIKEASNSLELIDQPFQKLTRLLAGRFPEKPSQGRNGYSEDKPGDNEKSQNPLWGNRLNSILLSLVLAICCAILVLVLIIFTKSANPESANPESVNPESINTESINNTTIVDPDTTVSPVHNDMAGDEAVIYSDWENCTINVMGSRGVVETGKSYTLKVCLIDWSDANVPPGTWIVDLGDNKPINIDGADNFVVPDSLHPNTNLQIKYIFNDKPVVTRTVKVK